MFVLLTSSAQSSKTSGFSLDSELKRRDELYERCDDGPVGMHRKSIEAAEHLKGDDSGPDGPGGCGPGSSPTMHNHHLHPGGNPGGTGAGGPNTTSSESGQESQDGMTPASSSGELAFLNKKKKTLLYAGVILIQ